jgi:hypothetical protein
MYRLPFGGYTEDQQKYLKEWMNVAEPFSKVMEMPIYAFDPLISLRTDCAMEPTVSFHPSKAKQIIDKFNKLGKE